VKTLAFVLSLFVFSTAWAGETLTLRESFEKALVQSESTAIKEQDIRIAEAHVLQAWGTTLPHLSVNASEFIQDTSVSSPTTGSGTSVNDTFLRRSRPEVAITLQQPIFQGFREFRALKVAGAEKRKNSLEWERAKQLLFGDVARAYYVVLELERELAILQSIRGTYQKRSSEIQDRIRLGKSRDSELLTLQADLAANQAEIEKSKGEIGNAREALSFLVGEEVSQKLVDEFPVPAITPSLDHYVSARSSRPDLLASDEAVKLAKGQLDYEKGARLPRIDFEGNYYPYRVGFQKDIDWDLNFKMNVPLFRGGATKGRIREAAAGLKQSELGNEEHDRRAQTEIRRAFNNLKAAKAREAALRLAESKSGANYEAQTKEYGLGLVNNLDVLNALREWQARRLETNLAHYQTKLEYLGLLIASGDLPQ